MTEFEVLLMHASTPVIVRLMQISLSGLIKSSKHPSYANSRLSFKDGKSIVIFGGHDEIDDMMPLLPQLRQLVKILEVREKESEALK